MPQLKKELESIKRRLQEAEDKESVPFNSEKFTSEARRELAGKFVNGFFLVLTLSFIVPLVYNVAMYRFTGNDSLFISIKDAVLLTTSTIGGPLGFIVGFYFKDK